MKLVANGIVCLQNTDQLPTQEMEFKKKINVSLFSTIGRIKSAISRADPAGRKYH